VLERKEETGIRMQKAIAKEAIPLHAALQMRLEAVGWNHLRLIDEVVIRFGDPVTTLTRKSRREGVLNLLMGSVDAKLSSVVRVVESLGGAVIIRWDNGREDAVKAETLDSSKGGGGL
jgi:hypothetical protein